MCIGKSGLTGDGIILINLLNQTLPRQTGISVSTTALSVSKTVNPFCVREPCIPCPAQNIFIHKPVHAKTFKSGTDSVDIVLSVGESFAYSVTYSTEIAGKHSVSAKIAQITPNVRLAVKTLGLFPNLDKFAVVVQKNHTSLRNCGEIGTDIFISPVARVSIEQPSHLKPERIRVGSRH